jgi:NADH-quinone oxidoreductase subunit J
VLVVFGVMLTAQGPFVSMRAGAGEWAVVTVVGLLFFGVLAATAVSANWDVTPLDAADAAASPNTHHLGEALLGVTAVTPRHQLTGVPIKDAAGRTVVPLHDVSPNDPAYQKDKDGKVPVAPPRTPVAYLLPFEVVSVHLTVVLIGAAYLARAKRRREVPA